MSGAENLRRLEAAHALFKSTESRLTGPGDKPAGLKDRELDELRRALAAFAGDARPELAKLADLAKHLTPSITPRTFANLVVPIERALEKNVRDDDFLVSTRDREAKAPPLPLRLVLHDLRSAFNVGSVLRSADGLGVERVHLCGYTPAPDEEKSKRSALGAQNHVAWEKSGELKETIRRLKADGWHIVALETAATSRELNEVFPRKKTALVFGNERFGLGREALAECDEIRRLDLQGAKNSLNVAVIAGIAAYEWRRQWTTSG